MMQKLRKVFALVASAALVLGLAACSGAEKPRTSTESSAESVQPPPVPGPETPPPVPGPETPPPGLTTPPRGSAKTDDFEEFLARFRWVDGYPHVSWEEKKVYLDMVYDILDVPIKLLRDPNYSGGVAGAHAEARKLADVRLREACRTGNNFVCDAMGSSAPEGSEERTFYASCGGRSPSTVTGKCQTMTAK